MTTCRLTFITPLFSKGSYDNHPEIRPPSMRGQFHWWFRALGGKSADEQAIFGGIRDGAVASKVVVRVSGITDGKSGSAKAGEINTLPHKHGGLASPKWAFRPGTTFDLHITERLGGLSDRHRAAFHRALEAWLLAGTLGLRATRAGGSFRWEALTDDAAAMPAAFSDYQARLATVFQGAPLRVMALQKTFPTAEEARVCVSDTLGGKPDPSGASELARLNDPLGKAFNGRKTSPLRFRIIQLENQFHIVAVWDNRQTVTGNKPEDFSSVVKLLQDRDKPIGHALAAAL